MTAGSSGDSVLAELSATIDSAFSASVFWRAFSAGEVPLDQLQAVFLQYYLWRNAFHRWFGVCIARSPAFNSGMDTEYILRTLCEHIDEEIQGDHHGLISRFLKALGADDLPGVRPLPLTVRYIDHFAETYMAPDRTSEEASAALAGRELVAPKRNLMTIQALQEKYGIHEALDFFHLHAELEFEHFLGLWGAVAAQSEQDRRLVEAAKDEIVRHVQFWDDVYAATTG